MARRRFLLLAAAILAAAGAPATQTTAANRPRVVVAELDGIIHPVSAEYLTATIDRADTTGADVVVFILRTPGGLLDSTRTIVSRMITSRAPVVVFVGPSGARAASAGFVLTIAADVAVMAPGTHIGAAHPVSGSGEAMDDTTAKKAASDTAAYVRSLAQARDRNVPLAAEAVLESRAFTDREALEANPPLIDFMARDVDDLLRQLDGRTIRRFDGRTTMIDTSEAEIVRVDMTRRQRLLSAIAHPQIAYLLLTLGALGLTIELWNPGAIVPGVVGGLSLLLAFFALQILPVNTTGLLLLLFGIGLLILELKVPSFGVLGIGGIVSLLVGSIMLTREIPGLPGMTVSLAVVVPVVFGLAAIFLFLGRLAFKAQARPPTTGAEGMVGEQGRARTPIAPNAPGQVDVHGEIWRAFSREPLPAGARVRVVEVNGLTLVVEPVPSA
jgi:membrane-bound serine protease (ClpP class)